ncbi:MAG: Helix-turn-helix domain [Acidobacteriota bacterium]|jgi:transcriptional regulator with XRE-family HTH domain|nr:Helix-turn-helix domain [Acidobacteriota bacterium]
MSADSYSAMVADARGSVDYWLDVAQTDFAREVHRRMKDMDVSPAELARRMGTSKAYVSQLLAGGNFTLLTLATIAMALGSVVRINLESNEKRA